MEKEPIHMPIVSYEADATLCPAYSDIAKMFPGNVLRDVYMVLAAVDAGGIDAAALIRNRDYHTLFLLSCGLAVSIMAYGTPHPGVLRLMESPVPAEDPGDYGGLDADVAEGVHEGLGIPREFLKDIQSFRGSLLLGQVHSADMYMAQGDYASCYLLSAAQMLHRYTTGADIRVFSPHGGFDNVVKD